MTDRMVPGGTYGRLGRAPEPISRLPAEHGIAAGEPAVALVGEGTPMSTARRWWVGLGLIALAAGVAASSLLGPFVAEVIRYRVSDDMLNQIVGGDAVALALVAPLCAVAGVLFLRGHRAAPVLALGPAAYALYMFAQLILGGEYLRLPGNNELFFPLHLGIFVLAGAVAVLAWGAVLPEELPAASRRTERLAGALLLAVAGFLVVGLHLPGLVDALGDRPTSSEYLDNPTVFWVVKLMDLGIVVPAAVAVGLGFLRGAAWARKPAYAIVAWLALLGTSVAAMAVTMYVNDDPDASAIFVVAFTLFAVLLAALTVFLYRPLFGTARSVDRSESVGVEPLATRPIHAVSGEETQSAPSVVR